MKKIKVLYVSHIAVLNGAPLSMLDMIDGMDKGKIVPIILLPEQGPLGRELRKRNIKYYIVPYTQTYRVIGQRNFLKELGKEIDNLRAVFEVCKIVKKEKVDVIHSNSTVVEIGAVVAKLLRIPHIFHAREMMEEDFSFEYIHKKRMKNLFRSSSRVIAISQTVQQKFEKIYGIKTLQLYDGIKIEKYYGNADVFSQPEKIRLLLCGQFVRGKGQLEALEAIKHLVDLGHTKFHLTLIGGGTGEYVCEIKRYIKKHELDDFVKLRPFANDLSELRSQTDISLTCSRMEALGRVTVEAMLAGNCVIGADTGGTLELIGRNEEFGYLYAQGNSKELADVILRVCTEVEVAKKKAKYAQEQIMKKIDTVQYGANISKLYADVCTK